MPKKGVWRLRKLLRKWELCALSCSQLCPWSVKLATEGRFHRRFRERVGATADLRRGLSAKSCPLASCCRYSCKAQIILSVWSVLHLYWTQPLSFPRSGSGVESAWSGGGGRIEQTHTFPEVLFSLKKNPHPYALHLVGRLEKCLENGNMVKNVKT